MCETVRGTTFPCKEWLFCARNVTSIFLYLVCFNLFLFVDVEALDLLFMTKGYVLGMIDELAQYPEYTTPLIQTAEEERQPPAKRTRAATEEASKKVDRSALIPREEPSKAHIKGKKPPQYMQWIGKGSVTADLFNLSDMRCDETRNLPYGQWGVGIVPHSQKWAVFVCICEEGASAPRRVQI